MNPNILFIAHQASRTGAPLLLLNTIKWLKQNTNNEIIILLAEEGILESEFKKFGKVYLYPNQKTNSPNLVNKLFYYLFYKRFILPLKRQILKHTLKRKPIKLIFSSTLSNGNILSFLNFLDANVITHAHELEFLIKLYGENNIKQVIARTNLFICGSKCVEENLTLKHGVNPNKLKTIHSFIPDITQNPDDSEILAIKNKLKILPETIVIGFSATLGWLKGTDLIIQLAQKILPSNPEVLFIWIGANKQSFDYFQYQYEISRENLSDKIVFIESVANPANYYAVFDIFVFPSREDSFGLVGLENALFESPIVCFDRGGQPEFVGNDSGFVVPYLDLDTMAQKIIELINNPILRKTLGNNAKTKVLSEFSIDVQMPKILNELNKFLI